MLKQKKKKKKKKRGHSLAAVADSRPSAAPINYDRYHDAGRPLETATF